MSRVKQLPRFRPQERYGRLGRPGRFQTHVTGNGNHRALVFRALGLPLVPATITIHDPQWSTTGAMRPLLETAADHNLVTFDGTTPDGRLIFTNPTWVMAWLIPADQQQDMSRTNTMTGATHYPRASSRPAPPTCPPASPASRATTTSALTPAYDILRNPLTPNQPNTDTPTHRTRHRWPWRRCRHRA